MEQCSACNRREYGGARMRRVMLLAAMLAMVLAAAAPAFAQNVTAINEGDDVEYNAVCQNILGSVGDIATGGNVASAGANADASVAAGGDSSVAVGNEAVAGEIAQDSGATIEQVNQCLNEADLDGDGFVTVVELGGSASAAAVVQYGGGGGGTLPETGGASLIALGAGALLVAGGLIARRIVR